MVNLLLIIIIYFLTTLFIYISNLINYQIKCLAQSHHSINNAAEVHNTISAFQEQTKQEKQYNAQQVKVLFNVIKHLDQNQSQKQNTASSLIIYKPTVGLNVIKYRKGIQRFTIWDLGGKVGIRKIWENYYSQCHGLIYMINHNIEEGLQTLKGVLVHQEMARIPVAVIAANQDEKQQIEHEIAKLECFKDRKYTVYCLPIDKMHYMKPNIREILHSLYSNIRILHQEIKQ